MPSDYGSGTAGGAGFGNKSSADPNLDGHEDTRFGTHTNTDPYSGGHPTYGSGATGGAGFGNKSNNDDGEYDNSDLRFDSHGNTAPYSGGTKHGSGSTGGAGFGNKTGSYGSDSVSGKLMEKVGEMMHKESLVEKGHAKRETAGAFGETKEETMDHPA